MENSIETLQSIALSVRKNIIEAGYYSDNGAHYGGCLSLVEILVSLYYEVANISSYENRDRIILSKGHGALSQYAVLYEKNIITRNSLMSFEKNGSYFIAHAHRNLPIGLEFTGGSLSLGISFAMGVAFACKNKQLNNRVFVIVGDGELEEGLVWESLMSCSHFGLDNVTVIIDRNNLQIDGTTTEIMNLTPLSNKIHSFGFDVDEIDGHDFVHLVDSLGKKSSKPRAIIANTHKGKGISFMEDNAKWHYKRLSERNYLRATKELNNG